MSLFLFLLLLLSFYSFTLALSRWWCCFCLKLKVASSQLALQLFQVVWLFFLLFLFQVCKLHAECVFFPSCPLPFLLLFCVHFVFVNENLIWLMNCTCPLYFSSERNCSPFVAEQPFSLTCVYVCCTLVLSYVWINFMYKSESTTAAVTSTSTDDSSCRGCCFYWEIACCLLCFVRGKIIFPFKLKRERERKK